MQDARKQDISALKRPDPDRQQRIASDPMQSVWVGASAGTGKTKVLTDRVLRLMLPRPVANQDGQEISGTAPERILCITFTKAAAAEMANRINKELGAWAVIPEAELRDKLQYLTGAPPSLSMMREARRLFARVVDVPGGMKIMTIHAFCQSILRRFPLEAGLSPHFEVMEERSAREYLRDAQHEVINMARRAPESDVAKALDLMTSLLDPDTMSRLMSELAQERSRLARILSHHGGYAETVKKLYQSLHLTPGIKRDDILKTVCGDGVFDTAGLTKAADAMSRGSKKDVERAPKIADFLAADLQKRMALFDEYSGAFLTKEKKILKNLAFKQAQEIFPDILDVMAAEAERVERAYQKLQAVRVAETTAALLLIGDEILKRYHKRKDVLAQLDYDDLIYNTCDLLARDGTAAWVLYKLDGGLDHILVDEAQDTNPEQWQVVKTLVQEFFSGLGTRDNDVLRTIFVVGDEKQSIFSFQRADPAEFARMRRYFAEKIQAAQQAWEDVNLYISFRSTRTVLELVDKVYADPVVRSGVVSDAATEILHESHRVGEAGLIEIWPLIRPEELEAPAPWALPEATEMLQSASARLADKIADTIEGWIQSGEKLESQDRPIRAGDIMVLVRRRGVFVEQFVRALKKRSIDVSGADRMVLTEQIGVMDLMALADFVLLPEDDLTLATILKSPLIGLTEEELFDLAWDRGNASLWSRVLARKDAVSGYLKRLVGRAGYISPYAFFMDVLNSPCPADEISGWRAVLSRLGHDAREALEEFLNAALDFETMHGHAMQSFLDWFGQGQAEIKRQQEQDSGNKVRIMTVHGSKGLQAPIIFLPDMTGHPLENNLARPRLLWPSDVTGVPFWVPRKDMEDPVYEALRQKAEHKIDEEYRRLLYVALTRAGDRLYVCGYRNKQKTRTDSWYQMVYDQFTSIAEEIDFEVDGKPVQDEDEGFALPAWRLTHPQSKRIEKPQDVADTSRLQAEQLPVWAHKPPAAEPSPPTPLMPSRPSEEEPATRSPLGDDDGWRFKRGNLAHQLFEVLPELPPEKWQDIAADYLSKPVHGLTAGQQVALAIEVVRVLEHPEFAPIFGPNSIAEAPIVGLVGAELADKMQIISGQIDRMVVLEDRVLIVDYKTNRPPPRTAENVPLLYLKQMAAYRAAVQSVYPDKDIECALLWTDGPDLMRLPPEQLEKL